MYYYLFTTQPTTGQSVHKRKVASQYHFIMSPAQNDSGKVRRNDDVIWIKPSRKAEPTVRVCWMISIFVHGVMIVSLTMCVRTSTVEDDMFYPSLLFASGLLLVLILAVLVGSQGPRWPLVYRTLGWGPEPRHYYRPKTIKRGYEAVEEAFAETVREGRETGIQFAAFVKGELVVDLSGGLFLDGARKNADYSNNSDDDTSSLLDSDTYSCVWSCSKVVTSIVVAWLVDRGYLEYTAKVRDYWPEFTGGGKDELTVAQVMKHAAGLYRAPINTIRLADLSRENILKGKMSDIIEKMDREYPKVWKRRLTYHGITRGWILNEIARRVDPQKRTIGQILREEFTQPLQIDKECYLGLPAELSDPVTNPKLRQIDPTPCFLYVVCAKLCQLLLIPRTVDWGFPLAYTWAITYTSLNWIPAMAFFNPQRLGMYKFTKQPEFSQGEIPSCNVQASARALATIANSMGTLSPEIFRNGDTTAQKLRQDEETRELYPLSKVTFNDGGFCVMSLDKTDSPTVPGAPISLGWFGFNGSLMAFHPQGDFSLAFQPTCFNELDPRSRVHKITEAFMSCARKLHGDNFGEVK